MLLKISTGTARCVRCQAITDAPSTSSTTTSTGKQSVGKRRAQLFHLDEPSGVSPVRRMRAKHVEPNKEEDSGWGVEVVTEPGAGTRVKTSKTPKSSELDSFKGKKQKLPRSPYFDMSSDAGVLSLALLQKQLERSGPGGVDVATISQQLDTPQRRKRTVNLVPQVRQPVQDLNGIPVSYDNDDGEDDDDLSSQPSFQITFGDKGTEYIEFDEDGKAKPMVGSGSEALELWNDLMEESEVVKEDFNQFGWDQFDEEEREGEMEEQADSKGAVGKEEELALLEDLSNEDDWGLEEIKDRGGRGSLLDMYRRQELLLEEQDNALHSVQWGGSASATGIDFQEQEELLTRFFKPHQVKRYLQQQVQVEEHYADMRRKASGKGQHDSKLHAQLKIISGTAAGRKLVSSRGEQTRPMMEKVRQALFNMIVSQKGENSRLPTSSRWLDLFAGTGSVGLEALSRGCGECHFVEMDPWVTKNVLGKNIETCGFKRQAVVHTTRAEEFLQKALQLPRFAGGPFDFLTMCPPYLLVSYPDLFSLLEKSPLIAPHTVLFVEYPKQLKHQVPQSVGPLRRLKDRKYGRTLMAVFAATG